MSRIYTQKIQIFLGLITGLLFVTACGGGRVAELEATEAPFVSDAGSEETTVLWPAPRIHPTMFYDNVTQRILMFSGMSRMQRKVDLREIWTYDTASGNWEYLGEMEPGDSLISLGFDEESRRILAFNNAPRQTWTYDLDLGAWEMQQPTAQPSEATTAGRRFGAGIAYDAESDRLILFGGGAPEQVFADTWAYDFNTDTWEEMQPSISPSPRAMFQMAYDAESDRVLLWGGFTATDEDDVQMWAYDYNTDVWEALENKDGPQEHWERGGMVYLPELDRMLLFTGFRELEDVMVGPETWYFDYNTNSWTQIEPEVSPPQLVMYSMAYDPWAGKVVLFGGELSSKYARDLTNDLWLFDPVEENWTRSTAPTLAQK